LLENWWEISQLRAESHRHVQRAVPGNNLPAFTLRDKVVQMLQMEINEHTLDSGFRKASRSVSNGACVEAASAHGTVLVRDSVDQSGPVVQYNARSWQCFLDSAKAGAFDEVQ
jgi:Domain of unknown function (DUF397)